MGPGILTFIVQVRVVGRTETVCQKALASIYGVSISRVRHMAQASSTSVCAPTDKRGKHKVQSRAIQTPKRKYLSPLLSIAEMHAAWYSAAA